jgi:hypothetical protein
MKELFEYVTNLPMEVILSVEGVLTVLFLYWFFGRKPKMSNFNDKD